MRPAALTVALLACAASLCHAGSEKRSVTATVQGKKLDLTASTVSELQEQVASAQGLRADRQAVFYKGKKLAPDDALADVGVQDGDQITVTAARSRSAVAESRVAGRGAADVAMDLDDIDRGLDEMDAMPPAQAGAPAGLGGGGGMMDAMFGGAQQKEVLEALSDPKKLEQSRQMLLSHPMYKQMAASVPGLAEAVNDPKKWKETMSQAREMMGQVQAGGPQAEELKAAMQQGMKYFGQNGGPAGGLGNLGALLGGVDKDGAAAQLGVDVDKLSRAFGHTVGKQAATMGLSLGEVLRGLVESARGGEMPLDAGAYGEQMERLLAKAGVSAGDGGVAHKAAAKK